MKKFDLSEVQAEAILNMRLRALRKLEEIEIKREEKELRSERAELKALLADPDVRLVTITVTEKGYCLQADGTLDMTHADIVHDLAGQPPRSIVARLFCAIGSPIFAALAYHLKASLSSRVTPWPVE